MVASLRPNWLLAMNMLSMALLSKADASGQLTVQTVYDSPTCSGNVVQNNYFFKENGKCTANTTCAVYASTNSNYSYVLGCSNSDSASTAAYSKATLGGNVDSVTWFIYGDAVCKNFYVAVETQMTTSLTSARCNPVDDGTSKKYTYDADKAITIYQYANGNCTGTLTTESMSAAGFGKCVPHAVPHGYVGIICSATIDGTTYGVPSSATAANILVAQVVVALFSLWAAM